MPQDENPKRFDLEATDQTGGERDCLVQEAQELMNIFGAIVRKME